MKRYNQENWTYDEYIKWQRFRADQKWGVNSVSNLINRNMLESIFNKIKNLFGGKITVGCMGIKNGAMEFSLFKELLPKAEIVGVDILEKVKEVGNNCYCYDFNNLPKNWKNKFDLVYSNSIDHSYDIKKTIKEWLRVTKDGGYLLIDFPNDNVPVGYADLYNFVPEDMEKLFSGNTYTILDKFENEFYVLVKK